MDEELLGLLGLCRKAGKLALGEDEAANTALAHKARLVLMAADAAPNTVSKTRRAAGEGNAPCFQVGLTKAQLGGAVGRAQCAVLALTDVGFAAAAMKKLSAVDPQRYGETSARLEHKAAKTVRRRREKQKRLKAERAGKPWVAPPKEQQE